MISKSSWYFSRKEESEDKRVLNKGRPYPGFTINPDSSITLDSEIIDALKKYRKKKEFTNGGGYKKLVHYLRRDYGYFVNHKKLYRICKQHKILLPRWKKKRRKHGKVCVNRSITGPNQLWEFDIKYGYIHGENKYFFGLFFIDVFLRKIVGFHVGLSCQAGDLVFTLKNALRDQKINLKDNNLIIRSDNGSQMTSNIFHDYISSISFEHEFIPPKDCNKNAHIESFNSIFETEFLQVWYFENFSKAYSGTVNFIDFYNNRRIHSSLNNMTPNEAERGLLKGLDLGLKEINL